MTLKITPLSDALGASVSGVDWGRPVSDENVDEIKDAFFTYLVGENHK